MTTNAMKKQRSVYSLLMFLMAPPRSLRSRGLNLSNCFQCRVCARRVAALWCASQCFQVSEKAFLFEQTGAGLLCGGFCWCGISVLPAQPHPGPAGLKRDSPAAAWSQLIVGGNFTLSQQSENRASRTTVRGKYQHLFKVGQPTLNFLCKLSVSLLCQSVANNTLRHVQDVLYFPLN